MKYLLGFFLGLGCLAQTTPPPAVEVEMGIDLNGEADLTSYAGWPLMVTASAVLWEGTAANVAVVNGAWTSALRLTIRNAQGVAQSWPLRLLAPASNTLALTETSGGEAIWMLAPADTAKIAAGAYQISVTLDTSTSAAPGAWKGVSTSRTGSVTFSAGPASLTQAQQLRKLLLLADAALMNADIAGATQNVDAALALKSDHMPALDRKGGLLVGAGKLDEARQVYQRELDALSQQFPEATEPPRELNLKMRLLDARMFEATATVKVTSIQTAGAGADIAQNTWIEIKGTSLSATNLGPSGLVWSAAPEFASGRMPAQLGGVSVKVNGKPAYIYYVSPTQVNVLTPLDSSLGALNVQLTNGADTSAAFSVNVKAVVPAFLLLGATKYIASTHANGSLLGPASMSVPGYLFAPAQPNETVILYATGFGLPSTTLVDGSASQSGALPALPLILIGGATAKVEFAGVVSPGLYQFNVVVPAAAVNGDNAVTAFYGGVSTPVGALITVQR